MDYIIQVVNQHAKIIDTLGFEVSNRTKKSELADMFNILSHVFPYAKIITDFGEDPNLS